MEYYEKRFGLNLVRAFVKDALPKDIYLNMDKIIIPSVEGDYSAFDVLIMVETQEEKLKLLEIIEGLPVVNVKVGVACI